MVKKFFEISTILVLTAAASSAHSAGLDGDLSNQSQSAREYLSHYPQCDYAHPDYCYELIRTGCYSNSSYAYDGYGSYGSGYSSYRTCNSGYGSGYASAYSGYSSYVPYPYSSGSYSSYNSVYSEGQLRVRFHLEDSDIQDGFVGVYGNRIFYSPDLQRLFKPNSAVSTPDNL